VDATAALLLVEDDAGDALLVREVLAANALLVIVFAASGGVLQARADDRTDLLTDRIQPARSTAYQPETSLVDQETGVRGYVLSEDSGFLDPYASGAQDEKTFEARLAAELADHPRIAADLKTVGRLSDVWRHEYAEPLIEAARARRRQSPLSGGEQGQFRRHPRSTRHPGEGHRAAARPDPRLRRGQPPVPQPPLRRYARRLSGERPRADPAAAPDRGTPPCGATSS
jgi:hypothetical protein